jgi:hypothetical protein
VGCRRSVGLRSFTWGHEELKDSDDINDERMVDTISNTM